MHGTVKVHGKNSGAIWVAHKAKLKASGEELVYMKCWHPVCRQKVDEYRKKDDMEAPMFDASGWALVCKKDLEHVIGSIQVDKNARI